MSVEIRVPALGESVSEATIGKWYKQSGDKVQIDEPLVELETDKVTVDVPAPASGTLFPLRRVVLWQRFWLRPVKLLRPVACLAWLRLVKQRRHLLQRQPPPLLFKQKR